MKRILFLAMVLVCVWSISGVYALQNPNSDSQAIHPIPSDNNPHPGYVWQYTAPGYKNATAGCTTATVDGSDYSNFTLWIKRSTDGNCDSCAATAYFDGSLDDSRWFNIESHVFAGKTADTLSAVWYWSTKSMLSTVTAGDTLAAWGSYESWTSIESGRYFPYYRWRLIATNAANCSTYFHKIMVYGRK